MSSRPTLFRSLNLLESSNVRRVLTSAARGCCLLLLASGAVGAEEAAPSDAPAAAHEAAAVPPEAGEREVADDAAVDDAEADEDAVADDAVEGEEGLAELPPSVQDAARVLKESPVVVCSGSTQQTFTPGLLLNELQDATQKETLQFQGCSINDGVVMTDMAIEERPLRQASCTSNKAADATSVMARVSWSSREHSRVRLTKMTAHWEGRMRVTTSEGTILSGRHSGRPIQLITTTETLSTLAGCVTETGLTTNVGMATLTVMKATSSKNKK
jgi:hypothetical protein